MYLSLKSLMYQVSVKGVMEQGVLLFACVLVLLYMLLLYAT